MEEKSTRFQPISTTNQTVLSSHPLISSIITLYILLLLYFPTFFLQIIFSPIFISTGILLLYILRLGAIQKRHREINSTENEQLQQEEEKQQQTHYEYNSDHHVWDSFDTDTISDSDTGYGYDPKPFYGDSFVEWDVRAPLEIIYEAYEGEEEDDACSGNDDVLKEKEEKSVVGIERYPSLSLYYPESDTDISSDGDFAVIGDWDSPERMEFRWGEEDKEGLIEIALDGKGRSQFFGVEEDNLIEIDISPARYDEFSGLLDTVNLD